MASKPSNSEQSNIWDFKSNLSLSETRSIELQRASMKLSGCLDSPLKHNAFTECSESSDISEDSELYNKVSKLIQAELLKKNFCDPAKALDEWACHLNSSQLLAAACILLKRMDSQQINVMHSLIKDSLEEPALFDNLTSTPHPEDELSNNKKIDFIDKLMSSLTFDDIRSKSSASPYRNSMPITREFTLPKNFDEPLFDSKSPVAASCALDSHNSRPKSFHEDNINNLLSKDWKPTKPTLEDNKESSLLASRIRPKSMYEPVMHSRTWQHESKEYGQHLPVGEADAVTWNIPLSPTVQTPRHPLPPISSSMYSPTYSEELLSPGLRNSINHTPELYSQNESYNNNLHYRNHFQHTGHQSRINNFPVMPIHNGYPQAAPNWVNLKDKTKRRSYGDHDIFPQGARNMFSNFPNTFRKHLMKPQNKVNFEILQDVPAWLRTLRLHKYTNLFDGMVWQDIIQLSDEDLCQKGISALGARRKMLKHFELVKQELQNKNKSSVIVS